MKFTMIIMKICIDKEEVGNDDLITITIGQFYNENRIGNTTIARMFIIIDIHDF